MPGIGVAAQLFQEVCLKLKASLARRKNRPTRAGKITIDPLSRQRTDVDNFLSSYAVLSSSGYLIILKN